MSEHVRISEAELDIMAVLWADAPLSAVDVAVPVPAGRAWSRTTIKTILSRLVDKGALAAEAQGRRFFYSQLIERDRLAAAQAGRLVDRLFSGRKSPLVAHLAECRELEPKISPRSSNWSRICANELAGQQCDDRLAADTRRPAGPLPGRELKAKLTVKIAELRAGN